MKYLIILFFLSPIISSGQSVKETVSNINDLLKTNSWNVPKSIIADPSYVQIEIDSNGQISKNEFDKNPENGKWVKACMGKGYLNSFAKVSESDQEDLGKFKVSLVCPSGGKCLIVGPKFEYREDSLYLSLNNLEARNNIEKDLKHLLDISKSRISK